MSLGTLFYLMLQQQFNATGMSRVVALSSLQGISLKWVYPSALGGELNPRMVFCTVLLPALILVLAGDIRGIVLIGAIMLATRMPEDTFSPSHMLALLF